MNWPATDCRTCAPASSRVPTSAAMSRAHARLLEDIGGVRGARLSRAELLDRARPTCGRSTASPRPAIATAPASTPCGTITTACRTRRALHIRAHNGLLELPITTTRVLSRNLPAGGGGYFRLLPYRASRWAIERVNRVDRQPAIFYFHPWEIDPHQPRVGGVSAKTRFRHYLNLDRTESRLDPASVRLPLGPHRPRVRDRRGVKRTRPSAGREVGAVGAAVSRRRPHGLGGVRRTLSRGDLLPSHRVARPHRGRFPPSHALPRGRARRATCRCAAAGAREQPAVRRCAGVAAVRGLWRGGGRRRTGAIGVASVGRSELARDLGVRHLELRNRTPTEPDWPRQDLYVTFRKALLPEVEANLLAIPRKQRAMVRKGIERGLVSEIDERVDRFFELYADNQHRHGTPPFPRRYFEALRQRIRRRLRSPDRARCRRRAGVVGAVVLLPRRGAAVLRRRRRARARAGRQRLQVLGADAARRRARPARVRLRSLQARHRFVRLQEELGLRAAAAALRVLPAQARRHTAEQSGQPEVPRVHRSVAPAATAGGQRDRSVDRAQPG